MTEPWFNPMWSFLPGTLVGGLGGPLMGVLGGWLAPQGRARPLVMGCCFGLIAICAVLLVLGIIALASGQPYSIWYGLMLPGVLGTLLFGFCSWEISRRYRQAELRRMAAQSL